MGGAPMAHDGNDVYFDETDKAWKFDGSDDGFVSKAEAVRQFVRHWGTEPNNDEAWTGEQVGHGDVHEPVGEAAKSAEERRGEWPENYVTTEQRAAEGFADKAPVRETETTTDRLEAGVIGPVDDPVQKIVPGVETEPLRSGPDDEDEITTTNATKRGAKTSKASKKK